LNGAGCSPHRYAWCHGQRITRWANTHAAEIDTDKRRVVLATRKYLACDRLIMANDSSAKHPPIKGFGAAGSFVLRDSDDMEELHGFIQSHACRKVIVASAALLGLAAPTHCKEWV